ASASLAKRIDDAQPKLVITADAGMRGGKIIPYKPLLDTALELADHKPDHVLLVNRGLDQDLHWLEPRDIDYASLAERFENVEITPTWVDSNHPSYVLYTSGTTGMPKGVQRDTGGYAVSLAASMEYIYGCQPGETILTTSDIGWVVGHSYIVYGPLIHGMTSIVYEGLPVQPDPGIWWKLVEKYKVTTMFSSPTAIRVLKKQDPKYFTAHDTSSLRTLFLAGEPLDETTHGWTTDILKTRVVDHYWQTESGWPILANCAGLDPQPPIKPGSPTWPVYGYQMEMVDEQLQTQDDNVKGKLVIKLPTPHGFMSTVWGDDERFVKQYFLQRGDDWLYTTGDYAVRDSDGYYFILGRDDDVINVAGHRLGSREIEETLSSAEGLVESAVIGVKDELKGQAVTAFVVLQKGIPDSDSDHQQELKRLQLHVDQQLGAIARPSTIYFVTALPKTRSGKIMRRTMLALVEGQPVGDISTIEDRQALDDIEQLLAGLKQS
ncbi:MAG: AMP-binding protein, partial [Immundisolibacteraceae bacterium]|nr:AMP-binding protein [Immundisolibacteraceae bacterium]